MRTYIRKKLQVQEIEDVQSLCRLCLGKTEEMIPIFDGKVDDIILGLPMRISMCLGLELSRDDMFPKCICQPCNQELDKFYAFKKNCAATYRKLKASLFAIKQNERKKDNVMSNQVAEANTFESGKSNVTNEHVTNSSQTLDQNKLVVDIPSSKSQQEENVIVDDNSLENRIGYSEIKTKQEDCHKTPILEELSELKVVGNITDNQLGETSEIIDVLKIQHEEKQDTCNHTDMTQCLPEYIVTSLIDKGVLARRDDTLDIVDQNIKTFTLETPCGSEVVLELVEEDPLMPEDDCNTSSHPKIFEPSLKNDGRCCGACGARFGSRGSLARHSRVHSGERPFACACGRRFAQREVLRRHQLLHSEKRPFACAQCPKSYTQRGALAAHARAHAPAARALELHRCARCPKLFLYRSGLSRHMSVHQGRQFACEACARAFSDHSSLQRHRRAHHRAR